MEHLASLRRRFQSRASGDVSMGVKSPRAAFNSKRAVKHWRVIIDKLIVVEDFLSLEESVNSWSPEVTEKPYVDYSRASCEQLADIIKSAENLPPLKSKTKPNLEPEWCPHLKEKLVAGANQHAAWVSCTDCHSRWKAPQTVKNLGRSKSKTTKSEKSQATTAQMSVEVEELKKELQMKERLLKQKSEELQSCQTHGKTMLVSMEQKLKEQSRSLEVLELMKSEYGALWLGKEKYQAEKGYHDGEMFVYAERWLERQEEVRRLDEALQQQEQLEKLQETVRQANSRSRTRGSN
jgi:hypothetical protein